MTIKIHEENKVRIAEVTAKGITITTAEDGLDIMGSLYFEDIDKIILHQENITPAFFELSTGIAGELLQKFSNYRVRLIIVGDFSVYTGKSIRDFIYESNQGKQVGFVASVAEALKRLSGSLT